MGSCCSVRYEEKPVLSTGEEGRKEDGQREGQKEREEEKAANPISHVVEDIVDAKHLKYMSRYTESEGRGEEKGNKREFWGIGIENETYLEWSIRRDVSDFCLLRPKRERYSADYYASFSPGPLEKVLGAIRTLPEMTFPVWLNAHSFQKTDTHLCHRTLYNVAGTPDPAFTESIHDVLVRENPVYREMYDQSVVFDGDTIEFITQEFYCATVKGAVEELVRLKQRWLGAVAEPLAEWTRAVLPSSESVGSWRFPQRNEGLVTFVTTNQKNLSLCNNQTIHLNLTLPSLLTEEGVLVDKAGFMKEHLDWVSWIQVLEPLIVAVYGTPDVFSLVEGDGVGAGYSRGSLRASRSRYISLQTYDVSAPLNGKLLLQPRPEDPLHWYNRLMRSGPYVGHTEIGYDVNVNKFKNHGIEVRFLDGVPEAYLPAILDMMVLLGAHSRAMGHGSSYKKDDYHGLILKCLRQGSEARMTRMEQARVWQDMGFQEEERGGKEEREGEEEVGPYSLLCRVVEELYRRYKDADMVQKMSPGMRLPSLVCYHAQVASEMREGLYGKPVLVVRAEASVFEKRVALVPADLAVLGEKYRIVVESSLTRCFPDEAYRSVGAEIVPAGSWIHYPHAWVVGLKGLKGGGGTRLPLPTQTLLHFAHCFKQQEGWKETLEGLGSCRFIDYEFMLDDTGKRTLSFCRQAGHVGALLGLLAYYQGAGRVAGANGVAGGGPFSEEAILAVVEKALPRCPPPRILLVGYGTVGKSVKAVLDQVGLVCDVRRQSDGRGAIQADDILSYDIYFHAIKLHPTKPIPPFLTEEDVDRETERKRRLTLLVDLSCDMGHPWNPLPIYHRYGTREEPVQRIRNASFNVPALGAIQYTPPLDVLAVPYLPSFDPVRSSTEFSGELVLYLSEGRWLAVDPERNIMTRAMARAWDKTQRIRSANRMCQ